VRDRSFRTSAPPPAALGPRLAGLAILCVALFGMATLVGLFANGLA
jgi:hypothetical protein